MPFIHVQLIDGISEEKIETLIEKLTSAACESIDVPPETIRVVITEVPNTHWGIAGKSAKKLGK